MANIFNAKRICLVDLQYGETASDINYLKESNDIELIQNESKTDWKEMYKVFNMGHRMELYVDQNIADSIIEVANSFNVEAKIIGRVEKYDSKKLTIKSKHGEFIY